MTIRLKPEVVVITLTNLHHEVGHDQRLSAHAYPREVEFVESLPKTPSGKVQRFILRNQEIAKSRESQGTS
jgi:acyl-coenzyme A synthetase/AMP-(fatty) acid ligase